MLSSAISLSVVTVAEIFIGVLIYRVVTNNLLLLLYDDHIYIYAHTHICICICLCICLAFRLYKENLHMADIPCAQQRTGGQRN